MSTGLVTLIGAGPGDPGLITVRALDRLRRAEVVVHDALVHPDLLAEIADAAEVIDAGKRAGAHRIPQEEINRLLCDRAGAGKRVVRLKGGDPFVFGRGGEEADELRRRGIDVEVVPGVSSAFAAAACAGIPVTHRGVAEGVAVVTGHRDPAAPETDWNALARFPGTRIVLMGMRRIEEIVERLIAGGLAADTPAAAVRWGSRGLQRTVVADLAGLPAAVRDAALAAPAVIIVGEVVALRERLAWMESRPLFGQRIIVTRPVGQSSGLTAALRDLGAEVARIPAIRIEPVPAGGSLDEAVAGLAGFDWIVFTSVNGVASFFDRVDAVHGDVRALSDARIAALGAATAAAVRRRGLRVDLQPERFLSTALADAFRALPTPGDLRVLLPRSNIAPAALPTALRDLGCRVTEVDAYRTVPAAPPPRDRFDRILEGGVDWVVFTSSSTVRSFREMLGEPAWTALGRRVRAASIGPSTSGTVRELGWRVGVEADPHTDAGIVDALSRAVDR